MLDTYANLQTTVLNWLARPDDPLLAPSVPDMIRLFEREATRRLKVGAAEQRRALTVTDASVVLPSDFMQLRMALINGVALNYLPPDQLPGISGSPSYFTLIDGMMVIGPAPANDQLVDIIYQAGLPPLSDAEPTNWLLQQHPDVYLFGTLVEAEAFIGHDERIALWAQRREAAFLSIELADRKARWGGPLQIRLDIHVGGIRMAISEINTVPPLQGGPITASGTLSLATPLAVIYGGTGGASGPAALASLGALPLTGGTLSGPGNLIIAGNFGANSAIPDGTTSTGNLFVGGIECTEYVQNTYWGGAWKYKAAGAASQLLQTGGSFFFYSAPSGAADATATFAEILRVSANGTMGLTAPSGTWPQIILNKQGSADGSSLTGRKSTLNRWDITLGDNTPETGSNSGSNFAMSRYDDSGSWVGTVMQITRSNGACANTGGTWSAISDQRVKRNIEKYSAGLDEICSLRPVSFEFNGKGGTEDSPRRHYGLVAQEVEAVMPELVGELTLGRPAPDAVLAEGDLDVVKTVDPGRAIYACINAIRELSERLAAIEADRR